MSDIVNICELKNIRESMEEGFVVKSKGGVTTNLIKNVIYIRESM